MKYKLYVIAYKDNPEYESQMAKFKEDSKRIYDQNEYNKNIPREIIAETSLEVILTNEQYEKVKEGVLTVFK